MKTACTSYRCLTKELESCTMNPELTMETLGPLHGPASHEQELMGSPSPHHHPPSRSAGSLRVHAPPPPPGPPPPSHQELAVSASSRSAMVSSMASLLDGAGDYRPELSIPLHHAMSMPCDSSPPGIGMTSTYTTLTPLQPLPPISTVSDKFHHPHAHHHHHPHHHPHPAHPHAHPHQRLSGNVSGSFTLMRDERGLPGMNSLYSPYKEMPPGMGQSLSPLAGAPLGSGLGSLHNSQQSLHNYGPPSGHDKMLSPNFDAHTAMLARGEQHLSRGLGTPPAPMMSHLNGMHHPGHAQAHGPVLASGRERPPSSSGTQVNNSGQLEEINTKEVAQRITAELKRYSIPQAIFAQRVLCRSQGTLSDLLRNPKPWSKLKSGRETFRRMWKWLQEPEFQRMSALRLAGCGKGSLKAELVYVPHGM
ncbi:one cut domain family member 2 isoform X2 [Hemicordylus capensis]|uniref:one cut domain family member 2 isoform X2 n=1 Tax=Hemicordylus capensis TaxID=884348 RepID=UPI002303BE99|nr:one cut domain family member 2 isoform X2 [Hemicordylus capensis]